jgi:hypothetical protein
MDGKRFDAWTKTLSAIGSRRAIVRAGAGAALAAGLIGVGAADVEACKAPGARCRRHSGKRCCAGTVCRKRHCQCAAGATNCGAGCCPHCCDGDACCGGCCDGATCQPGTTEAACGAGGGPCQACPTGESCHDGSCGCTNGTICGATCCPHCCDGPACCSGCCDGATCQPGTTDDACGTGGGACAACPTGETCQSGICACTQLSCPDHQVCPPSDPTCQACSTTIADPNCHVFDPTHTSPAICGLDSSVPGAVCVCLTTPTGAACVSLNGATCFNDQSTCTTDSDCDVHVPSGNGVCVTGCAHAEGLNCGGNGNACAPRCPRT